MSLPEDWRYAAASAVGTSHARTGQPCQDAHLCSLQPAAGGEPVLVAVVCDGAGSAARAEEGAQLACRRTREEIAALLAAGEVRGITRPWVEEWLARFHAEIEVLAAAAESEPRDFSCTLLAAVVGPDCAAFFQIGDGAIVVSAAGTTEDAGAGYRWVFWPDHGEYENVTFFATGPEAAGHLQYELAEGRIDEVALFSDGLQRLALHYQSRTAHAGFFRPMLAALRAAPDEDVEGLSGRLEVYLSSPPINDRTDDDKTLVLAARGRPLEEL